MTWLSTIFIWIIVFIGCVVIYSILCFLWEELMAYLTMKQAREQDRLDEEYRAMVDEKRFVENEDKYYLNRIGVCDDYQ